MRSIFYLVLIAPLYLQVAAVGLAQEPLYVETKKLFASDAGFGDFFGETIDLDGDTLVIGGDDFGLGAAYVFERNAGGSNTWNEVARLTTPDGVDSFGALVAVDGNTIAASSSRAEPHGAVYLFERDPSQPTEWDLVKKLVPPDDPDPRFFTGFIHPVIRGNTLLIGASGDNDRADRGGAVYVYERDPADSRNWIVLEKIYTGDTDNDNNFGSRLALDGDVLVAGTPKDRDILNFAGSAYIFERGPDGRWTEVKKLVAPEPDADAQFGDSVAIEGDVVVVGAREEDSDIGAAYVFGRDVGGPDQWGLEQRLTGSNPTSNLFGDTVAISGGRIFIAGILTEIGGRVVVFERDASGKWVEVDEFGASDEDEDTDSFGAAMGISGSTLIVGSPPDDDAAFNAGSAYVFEQIAAPTLTIEGSCPGALTLTLSGATPAGPVLVARSSAVGVEPVPGGRCAEAVLDLAEPQLLRSFLSDSLGGESTERFVSDAACETYLQVVDGVTCGVGPVVQVP